MSNTLAYFAETAAMVRQVFQDWCLKLLWSKQTNRIAFFEGDQKYLTRQHKTFFAFAFLYKRKRTCKCNLGQM